MYYKADLVLDPSPSPSHIPAARAITFLTYFSIRFNNSRRYYITLGERWKEFEAIATCPTTVAASCSLQSGSEARVRFSNRADVHFVTGRRQNCARAVVAGKGVADVR